MQHDLWLQSLFASIDAKDTAGFADHLTDEAIFQFGNLPPVAGREAIAAFVGAFFASLDSVAHTIDAHWVSGDTLICQGRVRYRRLDGREIAIPFANIMQLRGGRPFDYRIYADASPLFAS